MDTFGASGPANDLFDLFGFRISKLKAKILADLK
jgi:transketolase